MGDVKDNMVPKSSKAQKLLDKMRGKAPQVDNKANAESFVDLMADADELLTKLLQKKKDDLSTEKGQEAKNEASLAKLKAMSFHLDQIVSLMTEY